MKTVAKLLCGLFALSLLLTGCGGGGGSSSTSAPGTLEPGGGGLSLSQGADAQGAAVPVSFSNAVDINDTNEVVGFVEMTAGAAFTAGMWSIDTAAAASTPTALPPLAGNTFSAAAAIDENGNAVGQSAKNGLRVAVVWPFLTGQPVELPALNAAGNSAAFNISADGTLIVGEAEDAALITRAVVWTADAQGDFSTAPVVLPVNIFSSGQGLSSFSSASGVARVNTQVWVVGEAVDGVGVSRAALWRSDNGVVFTATDLAAAGDLASIANAVNPQGRIVGESETAAGFVPILWTADAQGVFQRTSLAAAGNAVAVNDPGRIAGWSGAAGLATVWNGTTPATLFSGASQAYSLNNAAQPLVVGRSGSLGFVKRVN